MKPITTEFRILFYFIGISISLFLIGGFIADISLKNVTDVGDFFDTAAFITYGLRGLLTLLTLSCILGIYYGRKNEAVNKGFIYCSIYTGLLLTSYIILEKFG